MFIILIYKIYKWNIINIRIIYKVSKYKYDKNIGQQ